MGGECVTARAARTVCVWSGLCLSLLGCSASFSNWRCVREAPPIHTNTLPLQSVWICLKSVQPWWPDCKSWWHHHSELWPTYMLSHTFVYLDTASVFCVAFLSLVVHCVKIDKFILYQAVTTHIRGHFGDICTPFLNLDKSNINIKLWNDISYTTIQKFGTVKSFIVIQNISVSNKYWTFYSSENPEKIYHSSTNISSSCFHYL